MKIVKEIKQGKESIFVVSDYDNGVVKSESNIRITSAYVKSKNALLIYNSRFEVISNAYLFLNKNYKNISYNTKLNYLYALKYFYVFIEIIEKDIEKLVTKDFYNLNSFLKGISSTGSDYEYRLLTKRSNKTLNIFFSVYREYFKFLGYSNSPILNSKNVLNINFMEHKFVGKTLKRETTPAYINKEEYIKIMSSLSNHNDINILRSKCIIRLMYESGLRLGEVLGLTFEDIEIRESSNKSLNCVLIIRNRITDREFQKAKTCMNIYDKRNYSNNDYNTRNVGYQEAILFDFDGINTYDLLSEYIDLAHNFAEKFKPENYKTTIADSVGYFKINNKENHYIFLNSIGKIISDESWNIILRKIFIEVGLNIDKGFRKYNLSHRFRHGFIMRLLYDTNNKFTSSMKVFTRHKSDISLESYNNPTIEDLIKLKENIVDEMGIISKLVPDELI